MINPTAHKKTPAVPPAEVMETHIQLGYRVPQSAQPVNTTPCPHCAAIFNELVAARNLITVYEQTAIRKAKLRKYLYGTKSLAMTKGGQR